MISSFALYWDLFNGQAYSLSNLENVSLMFEKNAVTGWNFLYMSVRSSWLIMLSKSSIFLLILCLVVLSSIENGVLKSPVIIVENLFLLSQFHFMHLGTIVRCIHNLWLSYLPDVLTFLSLWNVFVFSNTSCLKVYCVS